MNGENLKFGQNEYVKKLRYVPVETTRKLKDVISTTEISEDRQIFGYLN